MPMSVQGAGRTSHGDHDTDADEFIEGAILAVTDHLSRIVPMPGEIGAARAVDWNPILPDFCQQALEAEQRLLMARQGIASVRLSACCALFAHFETR